MDLPRVGSRWHNKKNKRTARVMGLSGPPWNQVDYRYTMPVEGRGKGWMRERTNTTHMFIGKFLEQWKEVT